MAAPYVGYALSQESGPQHVYDQEELEALFTPLDAPFSPYSSGGVSEGVSDSNSTAVMSPSDDAYPGVAECGHNVLGQNEDDDDDLGGFLDLLDEPFPENNLEQQHQAQPQQAYPQQQQQQQFVYYTQEEANDSSIRSLTSLGGDGATTIKQEITDEPKGYVGMITTSFHTKYWRNDRKNLQCFPTCPEFGDYYISRVNGLNHKISGGGTCSSPVTAHVLGDFTGGWKSQIIALSRINLISASGKGSSLYGGLEMPQQDFDALKKHCLQGRITTSEPRRIDLEFTASCWKLQVELSRKRRPKDMPNTAPLYSFEVITIHQAESGNYVVISSTSSTTFHIASTRTLAREIESKAAEKSETQSSGSGSNSDSTLAAAGTGASATFIRKRELEHMVVYEDRIFENQQETIYQQQQQQVKRMRPDQPNMNVAPPLPDTVIISSTSKKQQVVEEQQLDVVEEQQLDVDVQQEQEQEQPIMALVVEPHFHEILPYTTQKAYTYALLGFFGLHHFYLGRTGWGLLYLCTLGLFGVGVIYDFFRMNRLVEAANHHTSTLHDDAYLLLCFPLTGILGMHRFALGQPRWGLYYLLTFGAFTTGWFADFCRFDELCDQTSQNDQFTISNARLLYFPGGMLGLHHYYLGNNSRGLLYTFTLGLGLLGWISDGPKLGIYVQQANDERQQQQQQQQQEQEQDIEMTNM